MSTPVRFKKTGTPEIDAILEAVESAGKCYHDVNQWCEDGWRDDQSLEDMISEVAQRAADVIESQKME